MYQHAPDYLYPQDYLDGEQHSEIRHEYLNGKVYAMVGATDRHGLIAGSVFSALRSHLSGGPCQVFIADMKVRVQTADDDRFYYPDVLVSCDPNDREPLYRRSPRLIVAVLSESTERLDRGERFDVLQRVESLMEYVLVAQDDLRVEVFRRETGWRSEVCGEGDRVALRSVDLSLPVATIYEDVETP
ncbi:MAG: Uma2 family endonuclease [Chromatiales bacterium]|nr:Uma2 family endonuclease [Chromatiales bacterium]